MSTTTKVVEYDSKARRCRAIRKDRIVETARALLNLGKPPNTTPEFARVWEELCFNMAKYRPQREERS